MDATHVPPKYASSSQGFPNPGGGYLLSNLEIRIIGLMKSFLGSLIAFYCFGTLSVAQEGAETPRQIEPNSVGESHAKKDMDAAKQKVKKIAEGKYEIGDVRINSKTREITFPAVVNMTEGVLEYALVHENGKTHESLLSTKVNPMELNLALLLANYEAHLGDTAKYLPDLLPVTRSLMEQPMEKPGANRINIELLWTDQDSKSKRVPLAEWIHDRKSGKPLVTPYWSYTGSVISEVGFASQFEGSIIGIYFDIIAMINCPVPGNASDEWWQVETKDVPEVDTAVTVRITPYEDSQAATTSEANPIAPKPADSKNGKLETAP